MHNYKNISFIYQPSFKTNCFRVAVNCQLLETNYICVTCSPTYNGVYKWSKNNVSPEIWINNGLECYCVPIEKCTFVKKLEDIKNPDTLDFIKKQQEKWWKNEVKNRDYVYKQKPEWML